MQASPKQILKELTVLYAEDDPLIRHQMNSILEKIFKNVISVNNGKSAWDVFLEERIHIGIMDINMPFMNGLEVIEKIRNIEKHIPIIIISAHDEQEYLKSAIKLNLVEYFLKPIDFIALKTTLQQCALSLWENNQLLYMLSENLVYDTFRHELREDDAPVALTYKEQLLLELLLENRNRVTTRTMIEENVWGMEEMSEAGLKNLLLRLRKKIGKERLVTLHQRGYVLQLD